jgi:hypothetical protein
VYSASINWIRKTRPNQILVSVFISFWQRRKCTRACRLAHQPSQPRKANTREQMSGAAGSAAKLGRDVAAAVEAVRRSGSRGRAEAERGCRRGSEAVRPLGQPSPEMWQGRALEWN